jgi:hypothetical protein
VSAQLDSGPGAPADYIHSKNLNEQTTVDALDNIAVETDINVRGITRPDAFSFQLTPGKTYHLLAHGTFNTFSGDPAGDLTLRWVDDSNTNIPNPATGPDATAALVIPTTGTGGAVSARWSVDLTVPVAASAASW